MKRIWQTESWAITSAIIITLFFGTLSGYWYLSLIAALLGYVCWIYYRLLKLEKWISRGSKISKVYDDPGFVGVIIRHLYRQKKINSERKKRTREILGRLNRNISALPDATVLINQYYEIEWCNEPAQYLLSIHVNKDIGQRITNLIRHPEFLKYLNAPDDRQSIEIESADDHSITLQLKLVRFGDNETLLIARNISDQKVLQEGLKNFVANASHELKSPLTVINGHLEMLEDEPKLSENGRGSLQAAQKQCHRMRRLIDDLLLLSQVESYHLQPDEGDRINVSELTEYVVSSLSVDGNQERIECQVAADLYLLGVRTEIEGICFNLVENALKYTDTGLTVSVRWTVNQAGEAVFSVSDRGSGIADQDLPHITERYFRGSRASIDAIAGSGLGLSIVEQAAHKHGAKLEIDTVFGQGSTFRVIFPSYRRLQKRDDKAPVIRLADY